MEGEVNLISKYVNYFTLLHTISKPQQQMGGLAEHTWAHGSGGNTVWGGLFTSGVGRSWWCCCANIWGVVGGEG